MIRFDNVTYRYSGANTNAVEEISFEVLPGKVTVITGPSGCGKTTLMRLANGLVPQIYKGEISGSISVSGFDPAKTPLAILASHVGTLMQDPEEQFFALNVADEIAFALRTHGIDSDEIERRVHSCARKIGIGDLLEQDIQALSEGQKQKVGLASLLALGPEVFVFDEPSANLDPESTMELAGMISALKADGATILIVDHRLYWLDGVADEVLVMRDGRIVRQSSMDELRDTSLSDSFGLRRIHVEDPRKRLIQRASKTENPCLKVADLSFSYSDEKTIFDHAAFEVENGITALIGPNGTGKTTLARILTGLNKAEGEFWIGERKVEKEGLMPYAGLVLQNADYQLQMRTVLEEFLMAIQAARLNTSGHTALGKPSTKEKEKAQWLLKELNLSHLANRHPQSLSGGEKQRAVIGCALAKEPDILILDEPTSGLDGANMKSIATILRHFASRGGAVFLITHDLELLAECDRAIDMAAMHPAQTDQKENCHDTATKR